MKFSEFQFVVVPVLLVDDDAGVPYPKAGEEVVCRGVDGLQKFIDSFPDALAKLNKESESA